MGWGPTHFIFPECKDGYSSLHRGSYPVKMQVLLGKSSLCVWEEEPVGWVLKG